MRIIKFISIICVVIVLIFGCSFLTPPKEKPVIQDQVGPLFRDKTTHVFSLTPERRTVIVIPKREIVNGIGGERVVKFCAEPPPDVAESLADTFRFLAEAQLQKADVSAGVDFYRAFVSSATSLFYRSQGIQLFRDGMYNLCQAHLNGVITANDYVVKYHELLEKANSLILEEVKKLEKIRGIEESQKVIDAMNKAIGAKTEVEIMKQSVETNMNKIEQYKDSIDSTADDIKNEIEDIKKKVEELEK